MINTKDGSFQTYWSFGAGWVGKNWIYKQAIANYKKMKDTTAIHSIIQTVHDTVYVKADTQLIDAYQKLIDSQSQTYNTIIGVFVGVVALFAGATWLYNRKIAKNDIKDEIDIVFKREKTSFLDNQKLEFKQELHHLKAESSRLFALFNNTIIENAPENEPPIQAYANIVNWWNEVIVQSILSNNLGGERLGVDNLIIALEKIIATQIEKQFLIQYVRQYRYESLYDTLHYITDTLKSEKDKIYDLLNTIANSSEYAIKKNEFMQKEEASEDEKENNLL